MNEFLGSPPPTRGKVSRLIKCRPLYRITPAHAGKSLAVGVYIAFFEDHPRTRGEKSTWAIKQLCSKGSPPHTRGKAFFIFLHLLFNRITPAHAGKSRRMLLRPLFDKDHPRTRGEKLLMKPMKLCFVGSPPHTRGKDAERSQ